MNIIRPLHFGCGTVVKGFGRGSKDLGIPTANFPDHVVDHLPESLCTGIYYGLANVNLGPVYKMVMSIGWNPYFKNKRKSMEAHLIHDFPEDFYGANLRVMILGYIRSEENFSSLDALIAAIRADISYAEAQLDRPEWQTAWNHSFFSVKNISPVFMEELRKETELPVLNGVS